LGVKEMNDFGFTFDDSKEETSKKMQGDLTAKSADVIKWKSKCSEMHSMIMPLLNNLKKNPDKPTINWPNREERINEFIAKLNSILES
jgi:hypothetical protein